jgi:hypothetical protein
MLPYGINLDDIASDGEDQILTEKRNNKSILFIGIGKWKRGIDVMFEAFTRFNRKNGDAYTLHMAGISPEEAKKPSRTSEATGI